MKEQHKSISKSLFLLIFIFLTINNSYALSCSQRTDLDYTWPSKFLLNQEGILLISGFVANDSDSPKFFLKEVGLNSNANFLQNILYKTISLFREKKPFPLELVEKYEQKQFLLKIINKLDIDKSYELFYTGGNNFPIYSTHKIFEVIDFKKKPAPQITSFQFEEYLQDPLNIHGWRFNYNSESKNHIALVSLSTDQNKSAQFFVTVEILSSIPKTIFIGQMFCNRTISLQEGKKNIIKLEVMDESGQFSNQEEVILSPTQDGSNGL